MSKKNYNIHALKGADLSDLEFRDVMKEAGIDIPMDLVNTPDLNKYVINEVFNQDVTQLQNRINEDTGDLFTEEEAVERASKNKSAALKSLRALMKDAE